MLGLSFIGGSILEIVTLRSQKELLLTTLRLLGIEQLPRSNLMEDALGKQAAAENMGAEPGTTFARLCNACNIPSRQPEAN